MEPHSRKYFFSFHLFYQMPSLIQINKIMNIKTYLCDTDTYFAKSIIIIALQCQNIKRVLCILNLILNVLEYLKSPFKIRFQRKKSLIEARTHKSIILEQKYIIRAEIEKYFRSFLVQMKTAKSPFKINWPLATFMKTLTKSYLT